jgi:hypothetical protein
MHIQPEVLSISDFRLHFENKWKNKKKSPKES